MTENIYNKPHIFLIYDDESKKLKSGTEEKVIEDLFKAEDLRVPNNYVLLQGGRYSRDKTELITLLEYPSKDIYVIFISVDSGSAKLVYKKDDKDNYAESLKSRDSDNLFIY